MNSALDCAANRWSAAIISPAGTSTFLGVSANANADEEATNVIALSAARKVTLFDIGGSQKVAFVNSRTALWPSTRLSQTNPPLPRAAATSRHAHFEVAVIK